jgi:spore coat polysaccharide biosynthesis predicted glycosyltransferase SpsG
MPADSRPLHALFRVTAGPRTGFGHLVRAISLAQALGVEPLVSICGPQSAARAARRLGARVVSRGAATALLARTRPDLLVIDDRVSGATLRWRRAARRLGLPIVSIHDLGLGVGDADLIVDGSVGATLPGYGRPRTGCAAPAMLLGPRFAILNPLTVAGHACARARAAAAAPDVLIALGGGPRRRAGERIAAAILRRRPDTKVSVAGGFVASDRPAAHVGMRWTPPSAFASSLRAATVAVVGGGVTLYEASALGVAPVAVAVVASQRPTVDAFVVRGAALNGGMLDAGSAQPGGLGAIGSLVVGLLEDPAARRRLSRAARALVDARGAERVAGAVREMLGRRGKEMSR